MPTKKHNRSPHPIDVAAGRQVRLARLRAGLSQAELASAVGVTFQQVQKYERGTNRMSLSRAADIAQVLGISPAQFFTRRMQRDIPYDPSLDKWIDLFIDARKAAMHQDLLRITREIVRSWNSN